MRALRNSALFLAIALCAVPHFSHTASGFNCMGPLDAYGSAQHIYVVQVVSARLCDAEEAGMAHRISSARKWEWICYRTELLETLKGGATEPPKFYSFAGPYVLGNTDDGQFAVGRAYLLMYARWRPNQQAGWCNTTLLDERNKMLKRIEIEHGLRLNIAGVYSTPADPELALQALAGDVWLRGNPAGE